MKYSTLLVHISKDVHNELKKKCVDAGMTQREVIRRLIVLYSQGDVSDKELLKARDRQSEFMKGKIVGIANAARFLGVSVSSLKSMLREGKLKPVKSVPTYGGHIFNESDLKKLKQ